MDKDAKEKIENFFKKYKLTKYKKGELIYRPDDPFPYVAFIKSGYVRLYTVTIEGQEITINVFKPVFYLSLIYAITNLENKFYFEAVTPVELWRAPKKEVVKFLKKDSEMLFNIVQHILADFNELLSNIKHALAGDSYKKVVELLLSLTNKFGKKENGETVISLSTTHNIIASLTGLTRETVSIQMKKVQDEGLITTKAHQIVIKDLEKLKKKSLFYEE